MPVPTKEGFIAFRNYRVWYRTVGDKIASNKLPLLCLHGGPGASHDYFEPLEALADTGRCIIFYDQLGCGNSDVPKEMAIYTMALYLDEVTAIRQTLGLKQVHILGHSWGGMLAMEYALTQPAGLASLILADTGASLPQWVNEMRSLVNELEPETRNTILKHEAAGTTNSPEYQDACRTFFRRHGSGRIVPRPDCLKRMTGKPGDDVYHLMWGPSEIYVTGTLKNWDVTNRLGEIRVPTLVLGGRYDHATPILTEAVHRNIPGSEYVIFENSGHFPHLEETKLYLQLLSKFLKRAEVKA